MTLGSCELSATSLSASKMFGFIDHPQWQGEGQKKDGSDNLSCHLWGVLEQLGQHKNPLTSTCQGIQGQETSALGRSCPAMGTGAAPRRDTQKGSSSRRAKYSRIISTTTKCFRANVFHGELHC